MTSKDCSGISEQSFYFAKRFYTIHTSPVLFSDKKIRKNLFLQFFYATLQNKVLYYYRNKMENKEVISTLSEIKNLMEKSSKFLSLSGLSAIFVGIYAFIGAYIAYYILDPTKITTLNINTPYRLQIIVILALILLTISLITAFYLSWIKAKEWSQATIRFNIHTSVNQLLCPVISWRNPLFLFTAATTLRSHIFYHVDILWYSFNQRFEIYLFKYPLSGVRRIDIRVDRQLCPRIRIAFLGCWIRTISYHLRSLLLPEI